jgi:acyl carrier protein
MSCHEDELLQIVASETQVDPTLLVRDAKLHDLGIDSLDVVSVIFQIEDKFAIAIESLDFPPDATLGDMLDRVELEIGTAAAGSHR